MAAVLNARLDNTDKTISSINECFRLGIPVMLPNVNRSGEFFTIDKDEDGKPGLRIGLAAIKTVGEGAVKPVVDDRKENGPYQSIDDLLPSARSRQPEPAHPGKHGEGRSVRRPCPRATGAPS